MPKSSPSRILLPAMLALCGAPLPAAAQDYYDAYSFGGWRYRDYAQPSYGYPQGGYEVPPPPGAYEAEQPLQPYPGERQVAPPEAYQQPSEPQPPTAYQPPQQPQPPVAAAPPAEPALAPAEFVAAANQPALPQTLKKGGKQPLPEVARLQILLDRANVSPGVIDGLMGSNLAKAISALENMNGLPSTGRMSPDVDAILARHGDRPVLTEYVVTEADAAGPFTPSIPKDYGEMAQLPALGYRGVTEMLAERFHMDEGFLKRLNPGSHFAAGETVIVADVGAPSKTKVYHLVADQNARQLLGYDQQWNLVVAYPATIGSTDMPSPTGIHAVKAIAVDPVYWYRPKVNFQQGKNDKALKLAPGPNNPVGAVWIGLDKPTYGIHGTPEPSRIDKTNSHGCLRLTNWDANELAHLVRPGVDVEFVDPTRTASVAAPAPVEAQPIQPMPQPVQ